MNQFWNIHLCTVLDLETRTRSHSRSLQLTDW